MIQDIAVGIIVCITAALVIYRMTRRSAPSSGGACGDCTLCSHKTGCATTEPGNFAKKSVH